jgi:uroporphyrinogen decarboxylase
MRQAGRYLPEYRAVRAKAGGFLDLCYTPGLAAEVTLQPVRRFGLDAAILFSDILVIADALGCEVGFREGDGPFLTPIESVRDLSDTPSMAKLAPVYEVIRQVKAGLSRETALIGFAGGPWTVAAYMIDGAGKRDFMRARDWAQTAPQKLDAVVERITEATAEHLAGQIDAGAEVVQIFDSWAGLLPDASFDRFVVAPTRALVTALKRLHPNIPIIGFPRGAGSRYGGYFTRTGVTALSLDQGVGLDQAKALQEHGPVQGNLDPELLIAGGDAMERGVAAILDALAGRPFVFNLGHGILPQTPPENVARLRQLVRGGS